MKKTVSLDVFPVLSVDKKVKVYITIRGPQGCGKTFFAKACRAVAKALGVKVRTKTVLPR